MKDNNRGIYIIVIISLIVYFNSLFNGFVWDDNLFILKDSAIIDFKFSKLLFSIANGMEFIPMHSLTLAIDHFMWGFNPFGFHLTNITIYITSVITLYFIIINLPVKDLDTRKIAIWTCSVFAVHPMHSEPVNFISNRCHLLAFFFVLLSSYWFIKWLKNPKNSNIFLSVLFFILSLLSKQSAIAYPILVLIVLLYYKNSAVSRSQRIMAAASFITVDIIAVFLHIQNAFASPTIVSDNLIIYSGSFFYKIIKSINIYSFYIYKFIIPSGMTVDYDDRYLHSGVSISSALSFGLLIVILAVAFYNLKRNILITFGIAWYSIMLVPAMNFFNTSPVVADRYGLIPSLGLSLIFGYIIYKLSNKYIFTRNITIFLILILATITINRNFDWKSNYTLFKSAVEQSSYADRTNYAEALWKQKRYSEALATLKEEMILKGSYNYYFFLGKFHAENENHLAAIEAYKSALMQNGDIYKLPHLELAKMYVKTGDDLNAIKEYLEVIDAFGLDLDGLINAEARKSISILQNKFRPALNDKINVLVADDKNVRLLSEIALIYQRIGMYADAVIYYDMLIKIEPTSWIAWHNKALCFLKEKKSNDAVAAFEQSFLLNGKNVEALNHIGSIYFKSRNYSKAEEYFKKAVSVDETYVASVFNLARLYFASGRKSDAKQYFVMAVSLSGNNDSIRSKAAFYLSRL